jgi:hypothetical protein
MARAWDEEELENRSKETHCKVEDFYSDDDGKW